MKFRKTALTASIALAATLIVAAPQTAFASSSDCDGSSDSVCWWDNGSLSGLPSQTFLKRLNGSVNKYQRFDITDNKLSSAISRNGTSPADGNPNGVTWCWKILNQTAAFSDQVIARLNQNVSFSFSGKTYDNTADDMEYLPCA